MWLLLGLNATQHASEVFPLIACTNCNICGHSAGQEPVTEHKKANWVHLFWTLTHAMSAGEAVYPSEKERIFGQKAKVTARLADKAARRSQALALSYSVSMVASYLLIWADSLARSQLS